MLWVHQQRRHRAWKALRRQRRSEARRLHFARSAAHIHEPPRPARPRNVPMLAELSVGRGLKGALSAATHLMHIDTAVLYR